MSDTNGGQTPLSDTLAHKPCRECNLEEAEGICTDPTGRNGPFYASECQDLAHWQGYQEGYAAGESERDALRKEVERYKRALEKAIGLGHYCPPGYTDCDDAGSDIKDCAQCRSEWALSEAGKEESRCSDSQ
jgi:hypothetical protein